MGCLSIQGREAGMGEGLELTWKCLSTLHLALPVFPITICLGIKSLGVEGAELGRKEILRVCLCVFLVCVLNIFWIQRGFSGLQRRR